MTDSLLVCGAGDDPQSRLLLSAGEQWCVVVTAAAVYW
jgi:hypothetical protein